MVDEPVEVTFVDALAMLVNAESPSRDATAVSRCVDTAARLGEMFLGVPPERIAVGSCTHLRWRHGEESRLLLLGHVDTVWPVGTIQRWPFTVIDGVATGPGVFDMKAGVVVMLMCAASLPSLSGIEIILNSDEELGSPSSGALIREAAQRTGMALVFEPSADGALKTARKGVSRYSIDAHGRAAHAGLEPETGANAISVLSEVILRLSEIADVGGLGTSVAPTLVRGGSAQNTVPASASVSVDVRVPSRTVQEAVDAAMHGLAGIHGHVAINVSGGPTRPPLDKRQTEALFSMYTSTAAAAHHDVSEATVGGVSDGNLCADEGALTLDGLGAIGGNAHAEGEFVHVSQTLSRMRVTQDFIARILSGGVR